MIQSTADVNIFAATHIGRVRKANEDRFLVKKLEDGSVLLAVADGVGGAIGGDYAAETVSERLSGIAQVTPGAEQQELAALVQEMDLAVRSEADADPDLGGMGTALICVLLRDGLAFWVHAGDSRLYVLQDKRLIQITEDQTLDRGPSIPDRINCNKDKVVLQFKRIETCASSCRIINIRSARSTTWQP